MHKWGNSFCAGATLESIHLMEFGRMTVMKNLLAALLLASIGMHANANVDADWRLVGEDDFFKVYADLNSLVKNGTLIKMWTIVNHKRKDGRPDITITSQQEINCANKQSRVYQLVLHTQLKSEGEPRYRNDEPEPPSAWEQILPNSPDEVLYKFICRN